MTRYRCVVLVLTISLLAAGCGSDDGDSAGGDEADETSTDAGTSDQTDASDQTDETGQTQDGAASGQDSETSTPEVSGDSDSEWCGRIRAIAESDESSPLNFAFLGMTPAQLEEQFETNLEVMEEWADAAPPEIDADVDVVVDAYRTFVELGNEAAWDLQKMGTDPAFTEAFEDDALEAAAARVDAYSTDVCGLDLMTAATTPPTTAGGGDDLVTQLLVVLGLPPTLVAAEARVCMSGALEASGAFSEPIAPGYVPSAEQFDALSKAGTECGIDAFG